MSKAIGILRGSRRFTLLMGMIALLALSFSVTPSQSALAATLRPQHCTYYSDASHSTVTGWATFNCSGRMTSSSGTITAYRDCLYDYCCGTYWC